MSTRKKSNNFVPRLIKQIWRFFDAVTKAGVNWLLRSLLIFKRRSRLSRAGFVLPTVVMVILVVTLLTTAIMIRSFDRSKNASNVRVDQAVLKAATPALDRARAKIERLFSTDETELQGNTPPENNIAEVLEDPEYTFGDETQVKLVGQFDTAPAIDKAKQLKTAWQFPVDTDNNGKFDTYTLYGIYFRNPVPDGVDDKRGRGTTEARALPQNDGQIKRCASGNAGGTAGWYPISGQLKKAFFTYVANVPITDTTGLDPNKYEPYTGNRGFSALEMQLDQARIALDSNAVWYEDDLAISYVPSLRLNGRVRTNSNLLVTNPDNSNPITFLQVSSVDSCFYDPANAKIVVGGNVAPGDIGDTDNTNNAVTVDLFQGDGSPPRTGVAINASNKTTTLSPSDAAGNSDAYAQRLNVLVDGALYLHRDNNPTEATSPTVASVGNAANRYPQEVIDAFKEKFDPANPGSAINALTQSLKTYFAERIRRVSFIEVPSDAPADTAVRVGGAKLTSDPADGSGQFVFTGSGELTPPASWMLIQDPTSGDVANYTKIPLNFANGGMNMPATDPADVGPNKIESNTGDRIQVGNNLPHFWLKDASTTPPTFAKEGEKQPVKNGTNNVAWNNTGGGVKGGSTRERKGVVEQLDDLGDTSRNGFWETAAAKVPPLNNEELAGGLRVVTGAGIYIDGTNLGTGTRQGVGFPAYVRSFLPAPKLSSDVDPTKLPGSPATLDAFDPNSVVWPDTMPMYQWKDDGIDPTVRKPISPLNVPDPTPEQLKGDLQMRATVVYHYKSANPDLPIACISSYYDPTDVYTADNANGISNNGINYSPPTARTLSPRLLRQAKLVFPDGRWVNRPLYDAVENLRNNKPLSLADKGAIDAATCALSILDGAAPTPVAAGTAESVPDGAIKERAFLDARQVKALHKIATESDGTTAIVQDTTLADLSNPDHLKIAPLGALTTDYTLPMEQRQPLEVRVTEIDLALLKGVTIGAGSGTGANNTQDYLLPNTGIIYATRDDALPDDSSENAATDFQLDPTRRPNGIRLINGSNLERTREYRSAEKGLILASDLPVYIKGDFNLHRESGTTSGTLEEFTQTLDANYSNFYSRSTPETRFACRKDAPTQCTGAGDQWRAARILSDAITLLSTDYRDGFRYEGDYDLRNNVGNQAVEAFLKNGFWLNNFATTAQWYQTTGADQGLPRTDFVADPNDPSGKQVGSSYVMNAVTPIQRRVSFPAYKMEMCKKLPVSECGPQDWAEEPLLPDTSSAIDPATPRGTPLTDDQRYALEHYPRRVAFVRDAFGQLQLDANGNAQPITMVGTTPTPQTYSATPPTPPLPLADNALWFATTTAPANPSAGLQYNNGTNLLYYAPDEPEIVAAPAISYERQLLLPGTPAFPKELQDLNAPIYKGPTGRTVLNGRADTDPSDYAVCIKGMTSKDSNVPVIGTNSGNTSPDSCPPATNFQIARMRQALLGQTAINNVVSVQPMDLTTVGAFFPAKATAKVNIFDIVLPSNGQMVNTPTQTSLTIRLDQGNQQDPIFIFRRNGGVIPMKFNGVKLVGGGSNATKALGGVDPNNIFWVSNGGMQIIGANANDNVLVGNFLGAGRLTVGNGDNIKAGRILGFPAAFAPNSIAAGMTALKTTAEPLVVPVLQLHSPTGTLANAFDKPDDFIDTKWLQQATPTTFNAVFVMGDSPARPLDLTRAVDKAESNGGLGNFPRFLEAWGEQGYTNLKVAKISGGFIQFKRSAVATAPFETISNPATDTSLFFDGAIPQYMATFDKKDYRYKGGSSANKAPYYMPPDRQWGYDVGLLSQTPDLFSRRFVTPQAGTPNEFYREVSRDDKWVQTLLCAATGSASSYTYALPAGQRPPNCPATSEYND